MGIRALPNNQNPNKNTCLKPVSILISLTSSDDPNTDTANRPPKIKLIQNFDIHSEITTPVAKPIPVETAPGITNQSDI